MPNGNGGRKNGNGKNGEREQRRKALQAKYEAETKARGPTVMGSLRAGAGVAKRGAESAFKSAVGSIAKAGAKTGMADVSRQRIARAKEKEQEEIKRQTEQ